MIIKWIADDEGGGIHIGISEDFPLQMQAIREYYITFDTTSTHSKSKAET